ncbi:MAG: cation-transporting P-type ATPase [Nitrosomonas sp.]|jgi:magnesium-transporting ATPase (P-type)|uniref:cation-transporting P-type ATPase n=2 Tax=Nitrosomonas sp. TaxID=42353 RepID=UPI002732BDC9|nr:cation-transporting P-type ATPase [Nitrosomonas sp.]MDP3664657.1 cation-transporting P-type ATPase [Nitrosomonas sp.]MDZ4106138.1 cation-transporting P-type ATPase [Nitrosomonas sp.]
MPYEQVSASDKTPAWHSYPPQQVLEEFKTEIVGLSQTEAKLRLEQYGANRLKPPKPQSSVIRFLLQFHNVLIYILLAACSMTAFLGHWVDSGVILGVVVINAIIGFVQEGKAEEALNAIRRMLSLNAIVQRDGQRIQMPADQLVPGDIVVLQSGDKVPADLRLVDCKSLRIEEAALTGESEAVEKSIHAVEAVTAIGDRFCMAYSGTLVVYGQGLGVVVATAQHTEIGRISQMIAQVDKLISPLLRQMAIFGRWLTLVILLLAAGIFVYGLLLHDYPIDEMFMAAVSMAIAAIPEGLPAIMTITLALGVQNMARRNAIVRHLPAVEALGAVTVICTDKTGTLTRNEMTVQNVITAEVQLQVSGVGYSPTGGFSRDGKEAPVTDYPDTLDMFRAGMLCNEASVHQQDGTWVIHGDPTEGALITLAMKATLDPLFEQEKLPRTDVIPFESEHRFMATLHQDHAGNSRIYVKGAPEEVLAMCSHQRSQGEDHLIQLDFWHAKIHEASATGQRILAIASRAIQIKQQILQSSDVEAGFTLLGLVGIIDPPREEAIAAIDKCHTAGIRVKMITGDHRITACAIGAKLGIGNGQNAVTGIELDKMDDAQLRKVVGEIDIFARASPEHKLRLVTALQQDGEIVAMTGDGVNDAPALKRADIGVAMGKNGTEVAKEAAEMVLMDDNFASITHAVEEGRTVYDNIRKTVVYILPTSGGMAGVLILAIILGMALPITPVQILWINMVTTVTLAISLAFERPESGVMSRPPHDPNAPILSGFLVWRIVFVALLMMGGVFTLYLWETVQGASIELARTVVVNVLVMCGIVYLFNCRYLMASVCSRRGLLDNHYVLLAVGLLLILQLLFTYLPVMQQLFGTTALDAAAWGRIIAVSLLLFLIIELEKYILRCRGVNNL